LQHDATWNGHENIQSIVYLFKVLRAVEWVIFSHFDPLSVIVFVVAVGMWATRLRCPSCPQRCCTIASWSFRQGGAVLTIDQNDKGRF
jgi:hypothetical protein